MASTKKTSPVETTARNNKIREYYKSNKEKLFEGFSETAKIFKCTPEVARHVARSLRTELGINVEDVAPKVEFKIDEAIIARKENGQIKSLKKQLEQSVKAYEELSEAHDLALNLKTQDLSNIKIPVIEENVKLKDEATAIIQISDCHFGKIVLPSTVNGLNSYNPTIAKKRMEKLTENTLKLIRKERSSTKIDNIVVILGGDFIENSQLHDHSEMSTSMSPLEEVLFARYELTKFIKNIAENGDFKKIVVPCTRGNHSRQSKKMVAGLDYRLNYEGMIYKMLEQDFSDSMFEWYAPDSEVTEFQVYGKDMRAIHGERIRSLGGVGGLTIPLNKYMFRMDQVKPAYYNFMGHYHNYSFPNTKTTLNGSLCSMDAFAYGLGCEYQPAIQAFQLLDKKRGITVRIPIFCD